MKRQFALLVVGLVSVLLLAGQLAHAAAPAQRDDAHPSWSWDARYLVFDAGGSSVAIVPAGHGDEHALGRPGLVRGFRPGGDEFLAERGGLTEIVTSGGRAVGAVNGLGASWSPDGGSIAYVRDGVLYAAAATGGSERRLYGPLTRPSWDVEGPVWSPDGTRIVIATTGGLRVVSADGTGSQVVFAGENQSVNPSWASGGDAIAFERNAGPHWSIWLVDPDGGNPRAFLSGDANYRYPQWGTGNRLAYSSDKLHIPGGATRYQFALYVVDAGAGTSWRVLDDVRPDEPAAWSPTGAQLAAAAGQECGRWGVYVVSAERVALPHGTRRSNLCRFDGTAGNDVLTGSPYRDYIRGFAGDDRILARGGRNRIEGNGGNDSIASGAGADAIFGGPGDDRIAAGPGNDLIVGGPGRDTIAAGRGNDTVEARDGFRDVVDCGPGRDRAEVDRLDVVRGCERVLRP